MKQKEQKRALKKPVFAYTRSSRDVYTCISLIYPLLLFLPPACQSFLLPLPLFPSIPISTALHRATCSCRLCFIIPQLFRIHATPLQSLLCHPLSSLGLSHTSPSLSRYHTITLPSVKYTFVGGSAMWRPVIYFSSNCNFSNTYCPLDKCASLFLTR